MKAKPKTKAKQKPLRKFTLKPRVKVEDGKTYIVWSLVEDKKLRRVIHTYTAKYMALRSEHVNSIRSVLGEEGGSVKIMNKWGIFQEERTYPRGRDPKRSKG